MKKLIEVKWGIKLQFSARDHFSDESYDTRKQARKKAKEYTYPKPKVVKVKIIEL